MWEERKAMEVDQEGEEVPDEGQLLRARLEAADKVAETDAKAAQSLYRGILDYKEGGGADGGGGAHEGVQRVREESLYRLAKTYADEQQFDEVSALLRSASPFFKTIPKARTAKAVRTVLDIVGRAAPTALALQLTLCAEVIDWCNAEKRTFLRQRVQSRLASLLFQQGRYQEAVALVNKLLRELKRLDDKALLVETHLIEARVHHALRNVPKARAALTAARTAGSAIYIAPPVQAELDEMSGVLHCEESDYKTAFSYFLEAHEAFDGAADKDRARRCLKYMILSKVLQGQAAEVVAIVGGKYGLKYAGEDLDAMALVAAAAKNRSLEDFDAAVDKHGARLSEDLLIKRHLGVLYDQLLESNLAKIIEPFSCVEIAHIADLIHLPIDKVERKLSQMILDRKLQGILDQGRGQLIIYEDSASDKAFADGIEVIDNLGTVVTSLYRRAQRHLVH
ncbi:hypothetical protein JKP88DRAFT_269161 [Tribonema minus]|uniref:PCI domain-containing protein n=1 Tax=Tribonema minus TaxID=303371 RepID=A0A835YUR1_9STRA|nr:hypothetical protein JKP88DRAFT_269161 [Tribonema minus]